MKLKDIPKYTTILTVMKLNKKQRIKLYNECINGRTCYLVDANYNNGSFFEDYFNKEGELELL